MLNREVQELESVNLEGLQTLMRGAVLSARAYIESVRNHLISKKLSPEKQFLRHGFAWMSAYTETLAATLEWSQTLASQGKFLRQEQLIAAALFSEYLTQLQHGIAMSQDEIIRPHDMDAQDLMETFSNDPNITTFSKWSVAKLAKEIIDECVQRQSFGMRGQDETLSMIAEQFRDFTRKEITPQAHKWHMADDLIPDAVVQKLADIGVFGLTISEEYGGTGLGKLAMCVVTEELSSGYLGVGSLGTRSEIAGELIQKSGTEEQKQKYLPRIASGDILPVAVFTEPNTGSDLAKLAARARRDGDDYVITGNKTWITHGSRSDLMTLLVRSIPDECR